MGGGGVWWVLDSREDVKWGTEKEMGRVVRPTGKMKGRWGKSDLKAGHERPSSSTFDRT
jgi:hypothetical protein